jgi:hypothetical protein
VFPHVPSVVPPPMDGSIGDSCSWLVTPVDGSPRPA